MMDLRVCLFFSFAVLCSCRPAGEWSREVGDFELQDNGGRYRVLTHDGLLVEGLEVMKFDIGESLSWSGTGFLTEHYIVSVRLPDGSISTDKWMHFEKITDYVRIENSGLGSEIVAYLIEVNSEEVVSAVRENGMEFESLKKAGRIAENDKVSGLHIIERSPLISVVSSGEK